MNAYVLHAINNFSLEEVDTPLLNPNEVLVKVSAAGICGSDIPRVYTNGTYNYPLIPGHEFAGIVDSVGESVSSSWINKRVGVFPLIPCRECAPCKNGHYELCRHYSYLGSRRDGGFADYVAVPEWNLIELPDNVSLEAAAMLEPMAVAVHSMRRVRPVDGENVVVWGLGTIGMLLCMFLMNAGIDKLFVVGNKEFQKEKLMELGLPENHFCDCRQVDADEWVKKNIPDGTDVFFECVGKNETVCKAVELTAPMGRIVMVGNPYSDMELPKNTYWKILRNQLTVTGTWNSSFTHSEDDDWNYILRLLASESIKPENFISHRFDMKDFIKGFELMRDKSEDYAKVMVVK